MYNEEYLEHFGVLGMKWGRRKAKTNNVSTPDHSDDYTKKIKLKKKRISEMSNAELKTLNERMQLERQYKELTKQDMAKGQKFIKDTLTDIGKEMAKDIIKSAVTGDLKNNKYAKAFGSSSSIIKTATKKKNPIGFRP